MNWKEYQREVADLFISIGAQAETDTSVKGVRGKHKVDVLVKLNHLVRSINHVFIPGFGKHFIYLSRTINLGALASFNCSTVAQLDLCNFIQINFSFLRIHKFFWFL